ncbi:MAG: hypothetical protein H7A25_15285 [Leptospiraceae bacterium]|nr:hypothetical protein [Leptospiraceae bacterium]MCP5501262.1 hypothetical protein [Leptospiraceae bacterium]
MYIKLAIPFILSFFFLAPTWKDEEIQFTGEIVDSKCALGAMSPGEGKSHRICAIQCIKNGIPPLLKVKNRTGKGYRYYLLVGKMKTPANELVLPFVGIPVIIRGSLIQDANMSMIEIYDIQKK